MKFELGFDGDCFPINVEARNAGLRDVDQIRKELGVELPLERIRGNVSGLYTSPRIVVSEELARKSGHFQDSYYVRISVKRGALNKFLTEVVRHESNEETGEIKVAWIERKLNEDALLAAWEAAEFPEEWEP